MKMEQFFYWKSCSNNLIHLTDGFGINNEYLVYNLKLYWYLMAIIEGVVILD